jgi:hypothetical protein
MLALRTGVRGLARSAKSTAPAASAMGSDDLETALLGLKNFNPRGPRSTCMVSKPGGEYSQWWEKKKKNCKKKKKKNNPISTFFF